ncbi:MAG: type I restriction-modification system subunit M [Flavobacteriales bacterium]|nr:type I restriction-modification system subunit M [Flavobacteriales bacterium]
MKSTTEPKAKKPKANTTEPKAKGQEPTSAQDEQAFLNELDKKLWTAADRLRSSLDAAVYKHAVLGLIFLKYVSDSFEMRQQEIERELRNPTSELYLDPKEYGSGGGSSAGPYEEAIRAELEERDYYTAKNVFWVPAIARWKTLQDSAKLPSGTKINVPSTHGSTYTLTSLGKFIDDALDAVEKENPKLKNVLNKTYTQLQIEQSNLSSLIDLIATIPFNHGSLHAKDILGHVYEYFLGQFALAEGKKGGQYYTPKSIVSLIVRMLQPYKGRIYDPAMGSGGFFVQSEEFIEAFGGKLGDISVYGQESNPTTWRLAAMNMAIRGIDFNFGKEPANSFTNDQHPALRADFVMANPPFNIKEWWDAKLEGDPRWQYGTPPQGNANFAWVQHMLHHLAPTGSMALLLSNGSMSSNSGGEGDIRKALLEADLVECMVALPGQLFTNTQIPACIWFLTKNKRANGAYRERKGEVLFIDARNLGYMKDRVLRDFTEADIEKITRAFHSWQGHVSPSEAEDYMDQPGFCFSATLEQIAKHDHVLTPGRYVGAEAIEDDGETFDSKMQRLVEELGTHQAKASKLDVLLASSLKNLGYGG